MLKRFLVYYKSHGWMLAADMGASLMISVIGLVYPIINNNMLNDYIPNHRIRAVVWGGILLMVLWKEKLAAKIFGIVFIVLGALGVATYFDLLGGVEIPILQLGLPAALSIYFDLFSGFVQAFVFSLLSMVYIAGACPPPEEAE